MREELDLEKKADRRKKIIVLSAIGLILAIPITGYLILWNIFHVSEREARQNFESVLEVTDFENSGEIITEKYQLATDLFGNSRYDGVILGPEAYSRLSDKLLESQSETGMSCETTGDRYTSCGKELFSIRLYIDEETRDTVITMNDSGKGKKFE